LAHARFHYGWWAGMEEDEEEDEDEDDPIDEDGSYSFM
jgi:hypothetical protein